MQHTDYLHDDDDAEARGMIADLRARFEEAKDELDRQVAAHPFSTVGIALALGAVLALGPKPPAPETKRTIGGVLFAGITALAIRGAKAYAWSRLSGAAKGLFAPSLRERNASRDRSVEAFLEH